MMIDHLPLHFAISLDKFAFIQSHSFMKDQKLLCLFFLEISQSIWIKFSMLLQPVAKAHFKLILHK